MTELPERTDDLSCLESPDPECCEGAAIPELEDQPVFVTTEGIDTQPFGKVVLSNFIFNDGYGCLSGAMLTDPSGAALGDGKHSIEVQIRNCGAVIASSEAFFNIDTECPDITIIAPTEGSIFTEIPVLEYTVTDQSDIQRVEVFIDGQSFGHLPSGTLLDFLDFGEHKILITAEDIATKGGMAFCGISGYGYGDGLDGYGDEYGPGLFKGNTCSILISFTLCRPICLDTSDENRDSSTDDTGKFIYIGSDATGEQQADAVFEELRILDTASTEQDLLNDYQLMKKRVRYQNRDAGGPLIDDNLRRELQKEEIDCNRISIQTETLLLAHFDNNLDLVKGVDNIGATFTDEDNATVVLDGPDLSRPTRFIIDRLTAANDVDITVFFPEGEEIDKELLTDSIERVIPAHAQAFIKFVPDETTELACDRVEPSPCDEA